MSRKKKENRVPFAHEFTQSNTGLCIADARKKIVTLIKHKNSGKLNDLVTNTDYEKLHCAFEVEDSGSAKAHPSLQTTDENSFHFKQIVPVDNECFWVLIDQKLNASAQFVYIFPTGRTLYPAYLTIAFNNSNEHVRSLCFWKGRMYCLSTEGVLYVILKKEDEYTIHKCVFADFFKRKNFGILSIQCTKNFFIFSLSPDIIKIISDFNVKNDKLYANFTVPDEKKIQINSVLEIVRNSNVYVCMVINKERYLEINMEKAKSIHEFDVKTPFFIEKKKPKETMWHALLRDQAEGVNPEAMKEKAKPELEEDPTETELFITNFRSLEWIQKKMSPSFHLNKKNTIVDDETFKVSEKQGEKLCLEIHKHQIGYFNTPVISLFDIDNKATRSPTSHLNDSGSEEKDMMDDEYKKAFTKLNFYRTGKMNTFQPKPHNYLKDIEDMKNDVLKAKYYTLLNDTKLNEQTTLENKKEFVDFYKNHFEPFLQEVRNEKIKQLKSGGGHQEDELSKIKKTIKELLEYYKKLIKYQDDKNESMRFLHLSTKTKEFTDLKFWQHVKTLREKKLKYDTNKNKKNETEYIKERASFERTREQAKSWYDRVTVTVDDMHKNEEENERRETEKTRVHDKLVLLTEQYDEKYPLDKEIEQIVEEFNKEIDFNEELLDTRRGNMHDVEEFNKEYINLKRFFQNDAPTKTTPLCQSYKKGEMDEKYLDKDGKLKLAPVKIEGVTGVLINDCIYYIYQDSSHLLVVQSAKVTDTKPIDLRTIETAFKTFFEKELGIQLPVKRTTGEDGTFHATKHILQKKKAEIIATKEAKKIATTAAKATAKARAKAIAIATKKAKRALQQSLESDPLERQMQKIEAADAATAESTKYKKYIEEVGLSINPSSVQFPAKNIVFDTILNHYKHNEPNYSEDVKDAILHQYNTYFEEKTGDLTTFLQKQSTERVKLLTVKGRKPFDPILLFAYASIVADKGRFCLNTRLEDDYKVYEYFLPNLTDQADKVTKTLVNSVAQQKKSSFSRRTR
jgi:hypothetical protein